MGNNNPMNSVNGDNQKSSYCCPPSNQLSINNAPYEHAEHKNEDKDN